MRPSDKVWQGISKNLKRRNRRIGWIASLLLLLTSASGYLLTQYHGGSASRAGLSQHRGTAGSPGTSGTAFEPTTNTAPAANSSQPGTGEATATAGSTAGTSASDLRVAAPGKEQRSPLVQNGSTEVATAGVFNDATTDNHSIASGNRNNNRGRNPLRLAHSAYRASAATPARTTTAPLLPSESFDPAASDHFRTDAALEQPLAARVDLTTAPAFDAASAAPIKLAKPSKMSLQFFLTPTISYRKLSENKSFTSTTPQSSAAPNYAALYNINDAVMHKPNIGLEVGLTAKYPVARNLKVQGGLQFNMSRYNVHVFQNRWTNEAATMAMRDGRTAMRATPYSNFNGTERDWLQNLYFQVSMPVGIEVKLAGNDKTHFGIASTMQPTYLLSDRVFILSTDYKNYAEVPWLMRRLNINTALSTYVSYSTGKVNWQMGPQVRYQMLSSFVDKYPVKENLFDFGLRVGMTFNKPAPKSRN
ncbi:hypothetical protein [Flaviaesturariibacter amylovorans]|uniref:Outer membrane protein beta-barrel domain-containing protein n=1 Tax=Flaviaesturariibacter amylovorans TaxID=1084520 RepID=A0ABP8GDG0_9BACT